MKNKSKFVMLCSLVVLLSIVNLFASILIHENVHKFNYRHIEKEWDELCYFDCDGIATYTIQPTEKDWNKANSINQVTEFYAYATQLSYIILSNVFFITILNKYRRKNENSRRI